MTVRTTTLIRQVEADLRAAFPDVEFTLSGPDRNTQQRQRRRGGRRWIEIYWLGDPPEAAVAAVTSKHETRACLLILDHQEPCERCGRPTPRLYDRALCVFCEPALWGCCGEEEAASAKQRLKLVAAATEAAG